MNTFGSFRTVHIQQRVPFGSNPVRLAPDEQLVRRRAAPNILRPLGKSRFALFGLQVAPIERQRGEIEQPCEGRFIPGVEFRCGKLAEHEQIAAEQKLMGLLTGGDLGPTDRRALGVDDLDDRIGLPIPLRILLDPRDHLGIRPHLAETIRRIGPSRHSTGEAEENCCRNDAWSPCHSHSPPSMKMDAPVM